jgi:hypothetical protein
MFGRSRNANVFLSHIGRVLMRFARPQRTVAYGLLLLSLAIIVAVTVTLYEFSPSKPGTFYFSNGELVRGAKVRNLNPLLDLKLRILADYPIEKLSRARDTSIQQVNDPETLRAVYYNLFLLSDWSEIKRLFAALPSNKSFAFLAENPPLVPIVDILDSTILAAAYLYERLNMNEAAMYFYSLYLDCLRPISFSSPGTDDDVLGKRLMISRLKYYYLKEYVRFQSSEYPAISHLNEMLETRLWWIIYHRLAGYSTALRRASPDQARMLDLIENSDQRVRPFLKYERCILLISATTWSWNTEKGSMIDEACPHGTPASRDHYLTSFTSAAFLIYRMRRYATKITEGGAVDPAELKEIEQAIKGFYDWHAKEAEFLVDDLKVKFAAIVGNDKDQNRLLCEVAKFPFPQYDFAPYANGLIKEKGIKCD